MIKLVKNLNLKLWELNQVQKELPNQRENQTDANEIIKRLVEIRHH